ncbi:hypothetical protein M0R45_028611 [Rubus argutus]|uniref:Uncharacterized protein n=1 Tax=Rubus argutus TaxID=59490 RepID=A0AAW1W7V5_RUBAR
MGKGEERSEKEREGQRRLPEALGTRHSNQKTSLIKMARVLVLVMEQEVRDCARVAVRAWNLKTGSNIDLTVHAPPSPHPYGSG